MAKSNNTANTVSATMHPNYEWKIHYVAGYPNGLVNIHTHGLDEFGSKELQMVMPYPLQDAGKIINKIGKLIRGGRRFNAGDEIHNFFEGGFPVRLIDARESGRDVLRIILPDGEGRWPDDQLCEPYYKLQYNDFCDFDHEGSN